MSASTYPTRAERPRPKARWFFVGGGLLVLALASFVTGLVLTLHGATGTDQVLPADGRLHAVTVPSGEKRMIFTATSQAVGCRVLENGRPLPLDHPTLATTVTTGGVAWHGERTFTSTTGRVQIMCQRTATDRGRVRVRVGDPIGGSFVTGILATILLPMLLGLAGGVVLLVTTILWFSRRPIAR